ncbi:MAG: hypothetical protein OER88_10575, partial [Planctomycetota bacterium]|nr:hypothetical protein [Planctomycetota bacterium]
MRALVLLLGVLAPWYSALAAPETLSFDDVRVGMRGEGRTVFEGDRIEPFAVEIIGKLAGIGPGRDLILARLEGGTLERTGVFAGMSGSPVYLDGKLIGAVAYAWGFATEPIAGITPVAEMQRVDRAGTPPNGRGTGRFEAAWRRFDRPAGWPALLRPDFSRLEAPGTARRLPLPLAWKGADPAAVERWGAPLRDAGFLPLAGGSAAGEGGGVPLAPGAPIGIQLMRGDLDMTATGTVTWIDGDRIWAFGHPLFGLGATDLPLTEARVQTILPSLMQSARFATAGPVRGALRQDRAAAIFGRLGGTAPTIPVRVEWTDDEGTERTFRFDVADDPFLTPLLLYAGLGGILGGDENAALDASLELLEGSAIALEGGATLEVDDRFSGPDAVATGAALPAVVLYLLAHNPWRPVRVAGVQLRYAYAPTGRTAAIERIELDRSRARPGERVEARVRYRPFRGPPRTLHAAFRV